jgi:hypothetical protein
MRVRRDILQVLVGVALPLALGIGFVLWSTGPACLDEQLKVQELAGLRFEVVYTNCDTLAKEEAVRVYVEKIASKSVWPFGRKNERALLFWYDPGGKASIETPSITIPSPSSILISVQEVSSIVYQNSGWSDRSVNYEIGRVLYPAEPRP